jgi:serine/threonine protein kinase
MNVINNFDSETLIDERYKIDTLLGSGRSGAVYCARDMHLERLVGLKFLNLDATDDASVAIKRFEMEAKALHLLDHPNIVKVFRYGVFKGATPYLALEFIEGHSLRQELNERGKLHGKDIVEIAKCVCSAMEYAHKQNIIHRDLKPENIVLLRKSRKENSGAESDEANDSQIYAKVVDFGLCKLSDGKTDSTNLTRNGFLTGTPAYMAPEQCMGKAADQRADIYAFCCVLFEMLTGKPPFEAATAAELLYKQINEQPPVFAKETPRRNSLESNAERILLSIIERGLQKDPNLRFQSFEEVKQKLNKVDCSELDKHRSNRSNKLPPSTFKKTAAIFTSVTVLAIGASTLLCATLFKDELNLRVVSLKQDVLSEEQSIKSLPTEVEKLLQSGNSDLALRIVKASTQSSKFSTWNPKSQIALLQRYFTIYRNSGNEKQALAISIEILSRALRQLPTGDTYMTEQPAPELIKLINEHCAYIKNTDLDHDTLKRVSKGLEELVSVFPKRAPEYVFAPALLRCELADKLIRPNSWNDKMRVIRYYDYLIDVIAGSKKLAPHTIGAANRIIQLGEEPNNDNFQDRAQLLREVFLTRIVLLNYYCTIKDRKNADKALRKVEEQEQYITLSHRIADEIYKSKEAYSKAFGNKAVQGFR